MVNPERFKKPFLLIRCGVMAMAQQVFFVNFRTSQNQLYCKKLWQEVNSNLLHHQWKKGRQGEGEKGKQGRFVFLAPWACCQSVYLIWRFFTQYVCRHHAIETLALQS
jgi:hypothetical protein